MRTGPVRALLLAALLGGCAGRAPAPVGAPVADPAATAAALIQSTSTSRPQRITFNWKLNESGSKVAGKGVVRVEAPERIRLDLFGPRNETYLAAALLGDSYRLPEGVGKGIDLPSPAILWGGLGVIRPPAGATLVGATATESRSVLRYRATDGTTYQYDTSQAAGTPRLDGVERSGGGGRMETVHLTRDSAGRVTAEYRNWAEFRELTLEIGEVTDVAAFPASTWEP
jgi:hypothetical protein